MYPPRRLYNSSASITTFCFILEHVVVDIRHVFRLYATFGITCRIDKEVSERAVELIMFTSAEELSLAGIEAPI